MSRNLQTAEEKSAPSLALPDLTPLTNMLINVVVVSRPGRVCKSGTLTVGCARAIAERDPPTVADRPVDGPASEPLLRCAVRARGSFELGTRLQGLHLSPPISGIVSLSRLRSRSSARSYQQVDEQGRSNILCDAFLTSKTSAAL